MRKQIIKNGVIVTDGELIRDHTLVLSNGTVEGLYPHDSPSVPDGSECETVVDAAGCCLSPGFIDLHIHGVHAFCVDGGREELGQVCKTLPRYGVTGFLPTLVPLPEGEDAVQLQRLGAGHYSGARVLGFHLEGPYLSLTGALPKEALGTASKKRVERLIEAAGPYKAIFSISPEFSGITELLGIMTAGGHPAFLTHTRADVPQTLAAIRAGARHATHFYDVFHVPGESDSGVRPCGAVEAVLADPEVSVDFILDGVHVDPVAVKMTMRCKDVDKISLITDANVGAGLGAGKYSFGGQEIEIAYRGGPARLVETGALAGSGLTMNRAVKNAVDMLGVDLPQAVRMASANPAAVLGLEKKGALRAGYDADVIMFDSNLHVVRTWVGGQCVHSESRSEDHSLQ